MRSYVIDHMIWPISYRLNPSWVWNIILKELRYAAYYMTHIVILNCTFSVYTYTILFSFLGRTCIVNWSTAYIIRIYNNPVFVPVIDDDQSGRPTMLDSDAAFISDFLPKELKSFVVPPSFHPKTINGSLEMSYERKQSWDIVV